MLKNGGGQKNRYALVGRYAPVLAKDLLIDEKSG